jgi:gas vesicle protein
MKTSRVVLSVLAGAAVGALVGVLFAPDKGSNTRKRIVKKGEDFVEDLKAKASDIRDRATDMVDDLRDRSADAVEKFADKIHSERPEIKSKGDNNRVKHAQHSES